MEIILVIKTDLKKRTCLDLYPVKQFGRKVFIQCMSLAVPKAPASAFKNLLELKSIKN